jgi:copper chaperone CopZ
MGRRWGVLAVVLLLTGVGTLTAEPTKTDKTEGSKPEEVVVLFLVEGLRSPERALQVEQALSNLKGVRKVMASAESQRVIVVLDESQSPLSALLAELRKREQERWTLLVGIEPQDEKNLAKAEGALKGVKGVAMAKATKEGFLVLWDERTPLRYRDLLTAVEKVGLKAVNWLAKQPRGREMRQGSC